MSKIKYCINVLFDLTDDGLLYSGQSFYKKNLIDQLEIRENCIKLFFTRIKEYSVNDCLYVSTAPTHYEIQRALTFYLAVRGSIPEVKSISLRKGEEEQYLSDMSYTTNWRNCKVQITYDLEVAAKIFAGDGKWPYIVMTYFLKSQLASFSLDQFHAAWSCINAYYNKYSRIGMNREKDKLFKLDDEIRNRKLPMTEQRIKELEKTDFWDRLQWFNYVKHNNVAKNGEKPKMQQWLYNDDRISDRQLFERLAKYVPNPDFSKEQQESFVSKKLKRFQKKYNVQIAWLICEYCYMLRNRGFHADKPFPLFSLSDIGETKSVENNLSEIILLTVYELIKG